MSKLKIFISYASEDLPQAQDVYRRLLAAGYDPWFDKESLGPGRVWLVEIERAIRASHIFLVLLSKHSISKRGVLQKEIRMALEVQKEKLDSDIYTVPACLEKCPIPESLSKFQTSNLYEIDAWTKLFLALDGQHAVLFGIPKAAGPAPPPIPEVTRIHAIDRGDRFEIQTLLFDEAVTSTVAYGISAASLADLARSEQSVTIATFFYLATSVLKDPAYVFRGCTGPLDDVNDDIYVYCGTPSFDVHWVDHEKGITVGPAVPGCVFLVYVARHHEESVDLPRWEIAKWNWAVGDSLLRGAPAGWETRFRKLIFKK
jgi:hypothetical protein